MAFLEDSKVKIKYQPNLTILNTRLIFSHNPLSHREEEGGSRLFDGRLLAGSKE